MTIFTLIFLVIRLSCALFLAMMGHHVLGAGGLACGAIVGWYAGLALCYPAALVMGVAIWAILRLSGEKVPFWGRGKREE